MNHLQFAAAETFVHPDEIAWLGFVDRVEFLLGHDIDGDQVRDGYSLDYAYDAFRAGITAADHALAVQARKRSRCDSAVAAAHVVGLAGEALSLIAFIAMLAVWVGLGTGRL